MPYEITWVIEHKLILHRVWGDFTIPDIQAFTAELADYLERAREHEQRDIPAIFDLRSIDGDHLPAATPSAQQLQIVIKALDPRLTTAKRGFLILITPSQHVSKIVSLINRLFAQPMTTVQTMEEALTIIKSMYPHLRADLDASSGTTSK